jgi:hypothetical protein
MQELAVFATFREIYRRFPDFALDMTILWVAQSMLSFVN